MAFKRKRKRLLFYAHNFVTNKLNKQQNQIFRNSLTKLFSLIKSAFVIMKQNINRLNFKNNSSSQSISTKK